MEDTRSTPELRAALLDAALIHVAFDGWSQATFAAACTDADIDPALAKSLFPRGAVDLALAFHARGDAEMVARIKREPLDGLRFRDRIAAAVRYRLEAVEDKEAVRRATTLFALPVYAGEGAKAVWGTCDLIWETLGDRSDDFNWYSKRATLSGVYSATVLYWLGDTSEDHAATWAFLDRRIDDVMKIEQVKGAVNKNPLLRGLMTGPNWVLSQIKPPSKLPRADLPGSYRPK
ncbi:COQ9 family protein [Dinoroseobacter sp. PD6]|uniref:COQ9 family protein n=1 Tax=Dinoroseobacter sp. PD6 TaxID=3028384 RepID=UPI00237C49AF|nr:COQ9 family protein [Dinoroseobacter sp. PD6]MDD9718959.1 COQ9 family protein [Dinoroseobacter sp. PD6]